MSRALPWTGITSRFRGLATRSPETAIEEVRLYFRRACLAAAEERFDVAFIFCGKALEIDAAHLPTRLLVARIHHQGLHDIDAAVAAYRKVIALAGYEGENPYCSAARAGLGALVDAESGSARPNG